MKGIFHGTMWSLEQNKTKHIMSQDNRMVRSARNEWLRSVDILKDVDHGNDKITNQLKGVIDSLFAKRRSYEQNMGASGYNEKGLRDINDKICEAAFMLLYHPISQEIYMEKNWPEALTVGPRQ